MGLPDITPSELDGYRRFRDKSAEVIDNLVDRVIAQAARIEQLEHGLEAVEYELAEAYEEMNGS